jgi:hypothetical protein
MNSWLQPPNIEPLLCYTETQEKALGLLGALPEASLQGNSITFNAALSALEKGAEWQRALALLTSMGMMWMERTPTVVSLLLIFFWDFMILMGLNRLTNMVIWCCLVMFGGTCENPAEI